MIILLVIAIQWISLVSLGETQPIPRHPPIIPKNMVKAKATMLVDLYDIAYISYLAQIQLEQIMDKNPEIRGIGYSLYSILENIKTYALKNSSVKPFIKALRDSIENMNTTFLKQLAENAPEVVPVCLEHVKINNTNATLYLVNNPYGFIPYQDCKTPTLTVRLDNPLETLIALSSMRKAPIILKLPNLPAGSYAFTTIPLPADKYMIIIQIPKEMATQELVRAILEGRIQIIPSGGSEKPNETVIKELINIIKNGTKEQALNALRTLNEYAKNGLISWSTYAKALQIYKQRFGTPRLTGTGENPNKYKEEEVNLTSFLNSLQGIVLQAEKAKIEAGSKMPKNREGFNINAPRRITPPSPGILLVGGFGLAVIAVYASRRQLTPLTDITRIIIGAPKNDIEWCYKVAIQVLGIRGPPKSISETPREYYNRVRSELPADIEALLKDLTIAFEKKVYASENSDIDSKECARILRKVLIRGV